MKRNTFTLILMTVLPTAIQACVNPLGTSSTVDTTYQQPPPPFPRTFGFSDPSLYTLSSSGIAISGNIAQVTKPSQTDDSDDPSSGFGAGTPNDIQWNPGGWLELDSAGMIAGNGSFASRVFDAGTPTIWNLLSWIPVFPSDKPLPSAGASETAYATGNANMAGNIGLYHFEDAALSTTAADSSPLANDAVCAGASCPTFAVPGKLSNAASFDGVNNWLALGNSADLQLTTGTVEAWINTAGTGAGDAGIVVKANAYGIFLSNNIFVAFDWGAPAYRTTGVNLADSLWHHVAYTFQSGVLNGSALYIDGVSKLTTTMTVSNQSNGLAIGDGNNPGPAQPFHGLIDEAAVFNRVLGAPEISDHYKRGALRLKFQARSCPDAVCAATAWVGPDGTAATFFSELSNATTALPSVAIPGLASNPYFQYQTIFETDNPALSPQLSSVSAGPAHFDSSNPSVTLVSGGQTYAALTGFTETPGPANAGTIQYQISNDGTDWYYWDGSTWSSASGYAQSNPATTINANISSFASTIGVGTFYFSAFLHSASASQAVQLQSLTLSGNR